MNNCNKKRPLPPINYVGVIGPTARCNKSSIYIFKW